MQLSADGRRELRFGRETEPQLIGQCGWGSHRSRGVRSDAFGWPRRPARPARAAGPLGPARAAGPARAGDAPVDVRPRAAEHRAGPVDAEPLEAENAHLAEAVDAGVNGVRVVVAAVCECTGCEDGRGDERATDSSFAKVLPFILSLLAP
jgi:hypothetical protein